ncbi:IS4 family transposase [Desulfoluna spongiiphila]|uniref:IS4 family transposase n=1 Tax=Desulfoluna spongiiphila TaxID=419481 RepID=UPI00125EE52E|nr:IS4 family transposase [Desulfoluna spongiiphila]
MSRINFLVQFMVALLKVRTVNLAELSLALSPKAKVSSNYKRLQRFMRLHEIDFDSFGHFFSRLLPVSDGKWLLAMDRTNWKFGRVDINILMLGVAWNGVAFPLLWVFLPKRGNSNTAERIQLLNRLISTFGVDRIQSLTADREFVGQKWFNWLNGKNIPYVIRIRENFYVSSRKGNRVKVKELFKGLKNGESRIIQGKRRLCGVPLHLVGMKVKPKEYLILVTNKSPKVASEEYKQRWSIETLFGCLKIRGFNFEDTHITEPSRIMNLTALLAVTFTWCHLTGEWKATAEPIPLKKHGRRAISFFRYELDALREIFLSAEQMLKPKHPKVRKITELLTFRLQRTFAQIVT